MAAWKTANGRRRVAPGSQYGRRQAYGHNGRTEKLSVGPWRCGGTTGWCIRARW